MEALCSEPNEHVNKYRVQEGKYYVHQTFVEVRWLVLEPRYRIIKIERVFEADAACGTTRMAEYSIPGSLETGSIYLDTALLYEIHY